MNDYKISKNFGMDITFEELVKYNETCKINLNSTHHFETYKGILIYVSHPQGKEKLSIELGVDEEGFMYEGDYGCQEDFKEIPIEEGLKILEKYRELLVAKSYLEYLMLKNKLDKDVIMVKIK